MCNECIKKAYPDRDAICLEKGAYFLNFTSCAKCKEKDVLGTLNERRDEIEEEEIVTYQHVCKNCDHIIAEHVYKFRVEEDYQIYEMDCLLCGVGEDQRSILPNDPRQLQMLF